jgi:Trk-type K+ transport system membrane component
VAFEVLNIGNPATGSITTHFRVLNGLFQAFAVRTGGFYVVNISQLRPGLLCLYVYMIYLCALPVTLTLRNTNIYEERSLDIFAEEVGHQPSHPRKPSPSPSSSSPPPERQRRDSTSTNLARSLKRHLTNSHPPNEAPHNPATTGWSRRNFLLQQLRGQLSHDLCWIALAILLITIIETAQSTRNPIVFSVFNIIFECVSAYGGVGISVGVPWESYSFSGAWHSTSKLVLCAVMLRRRHRGLPVAVDQAVLVPDERLGWAEEEDAVLRARSRALDGRGKSGDEQ